VTEIRPTWGAILLAGQRHQPYFSLALRSTITALSFLGAFGFYYTFEARDRSVTCVTSGLVIDVKDFRPGSGIGSGIGNSFGVTVDTPELAIYH
jgi:hypothetical protein